MIYLNAAISLLGAAAAAYWGLLGYSVALLLLLNGYLLLYLFDVQRVSKAFNSIVNREGASSGSKSSSISSMLTRLFELADALKYRLSSLETQVDTLAAERTKEPQGILRKSEIFVDGETATSEESIFEETLVDARKRLSADAIAICWTVDKTADCASYRTLIEGFGGQRLETELKKLAGAVFNSTLSKLPPLVDTTLISQRKVDFPFLGIDHIIQVPFIWNKGSKQVNSLLWAGYKKINIPSESEARLAQRIAETLSRDLDGVFKLAELTGRVAEAETSNKEKSEFLAQMSHDIKSPLNNIATILQYLQSSVRDDDSLEMISVGRANVQTMLELLQTILDFSKHRVGKLEAIPADVDLHKTMAEVAEAYAISAKLRKNVLVLDCAPMPAEIRADAQHVKRILTNLVSNANKFTESGRIVLKSEKRPNNTWAVSVSDTGRGMSSAELTQLFTPYTRFNPKGVEGVGLGLALTKVLCEKNQAEISVSSEEGRYTTFTLVFNSQQAKPAGPEKVLPNVVPAVASTAVTAPRTEPITVLVVDDDESTVKTLDRFLTSKGYAVLRATSVPDAISIFNFDTPLVVVTDEGMPDGGAEALIRYIKDSGQRSSVFVLTGNDDPALERKLAKAGVVCVLQKPLDAERLLSELDNVVRSTSTSLTAAAANA